MIEIREKKDCCGCGACANVCPAGCIAMEADEEGFLYPKIDAAACVGCGLCEKVCPVLHSGEDRPFDQTAWLLQYRGAAVRRESTSGGAFTAIARYVLERGGVVFGAAFDEKLRVHHRGVEKGRDLSAFRGSKYVQSDTGSSFRQVRDLLQAGRLVCYSGTPCQIEGLLGYLQKPYENLLTVDVVCHAVPSPLVWDRYLEMQEARLGRKIGDAKFRDKHFGYQYSTMTLLDEAGEEIYAQGIDTDPMLRAFFSDICDRPSCYACSFKKRYRKSDFTIWDCYPVYAFDKRLDDDKGTSRVLIHTDKGRRVFEEIRGLCRVLEVEPDRLTAGVREMFHSVNGNPRREEFFEDAACMDAAALFDRYFPVNAKRKLERAARRFCYKTGIYGAAKRAARKILGKDE